LTAALGGGPPRLPADAALISYWLGTESAYAWVMSPGSVHWVRLTSSTEIARQAREFHRSLTELVGMPAAQRLRNARTLADLVVQPLERWLASARLWIVVPDGELDYVPVAALRVFEGGAESFAILHHDVALVPAAWMLSNARSAEVPHERALLLVADPVYQSDDPRLRKFTLRKAASRDDAVEGESAAQYQRLPYTAEEAYQILEQFPAAAWMSSQASKPREIICCRSTCRAIGSSTSPLTAWWTRRCRSFPR